MPEVLVVSTGQLGFNLRRSVYGQEISTYKEGDDDYNIVDAYARRPAQE
jgi:multidrug efflux pump